MYSVQTYYYTSVDILISYIKYYDNTQYIFNILTIYLQYRYINIYGGPKKSGLF